tara:strand:- start:204 stop:977 length:774 start_codon:yes stop_codon:yes gene_type:complete
MEKVKKTDNPLEKDWVVKDRVYYLTTREKPLVYTVAGRHSTKRPLVWFDEKTGVQRELRYATNQNSCFVDEQKGQATLGRIVFRNGALAVSARKQNLQKLLSLYHPLKGLFFEEHDAVQEATDDVSYLNAEVDALIAARDLAVDEAEAILRVELGTKVSEMDSKEIKRDILLFARRNPGLFLELMQDDNVHLRNFGIKAMEAGIIKLSPDNRTFTWASNGRKLMNVPFEEHPYSALASWFKTDEGLDVVKSIEKRLK